MNPGRGVFVTGTGTEVGKSIVAGAIAATAARNGDRVAVFKPAVSGLDEGGEADHELLARAARSAQSADEVAPYRYGPPLSPHLAAELNGERIDPAKLRDAAAAAGDRADALVCEGVGGLLVPLTPSYLVRDLIGDLGLPVVVAAHPGLGTINHTLLTLEAARTAGLSVRAVVLTPWPRRDDEPAAAATTLEESNRRTISELGRVDVHVLPTVDRGTPERWPALPLV